MNIQLGVGIIMINSDQKVLLCKRLSKHGEGLYSIPGGKVDFGESIQKSAIREVFEETGLHIKHMKFVGVCNNLKTLKTEGIHSVSIIFSCDNFDGEVELKEPKVHKYWYWADLKQGIPEPHFEASMSALTMFESGIVGLTD